MHQPIYIGVGKPGRLLDGEHGDLLAILGVPPHCGLASPTEFGYFMHVMLRHDISHGASSPGHFDWLALRTVDQLAEPALGLNRSNSNHNKLLVLSNMAILAISRIFSRMEKRLCRSSNLLELAPAILVEPAVAGQDVEFFQQFDRPIGRDRVFFLHLAFRLMVTCCIAAYPASPGVRPRVYLP
jgi:hypothetical protein